MSSKPTAKPQPSQRGKISKCELARRLRLSERYVHTLFKNKTPSRELAERIARLYGGEAEDYLRAPRPRGRARPHPFRSFIEQKVEEDEMAACDTGTSRDECGLLAFAFCNMYIGFKPPKPPADFVTMESLVSFVASTGHFSIEQRDNVGRLWKLFRLWREEQLYMERIWEIENEEANEFG